jgi:hypothetical protein
MRGQLTALGTVVLALTLQGQAPNESGSSELVRQCKLAQGQAKSIQDVTKLADVLQCMRYIEGFVAGVSTARETRPFCVPNTIRIIEEVNSYVSWMDKHPDTWRQPRHITLLNALVETYPCQK